MENVKEESRTISAPYTFARCFNAQCSKAEKCLRRMAALYDTNSYPFISIVNPDCLPADTCNCPHFRDAEKIHVAWGLKNLFDRIPYVDAISLRSQLLGHYGKTTYYRFYRGEHYLSPNEQNYIRRLFRQKGITDEPAFERYTDEYKW